MDSLITHCTNPEQSKPREGLSPPHTYGTPIYFLASFTTREPGLLFSVRILVVFCLLASSLNSLSITYIKLNNYELVWEDKIGIKPYLGLRMQRYTNIMPSNYQSSISLCFENR